MNFVKDLKDNQEIEDCYLIQNKTVMIDRNGKSYVALTLKDKTGTVDGRIWNCDAEAIKVIKDNEFIKVWGIAHIYNNEMQLSIKKFEMCDKRTIDKANYIPSAPRSISEMTEELYNIIDNVNNEYLKWLLEDIFITQVQTAKDFTERSAAKSVHHNYLGGLLEHSLNVTYHCRSVIKRYQYPIDEEIITTIALLHDIGKIRELSDFPENDYTDEGKLLGHIYMGTQMISDVISKREDFPEELKNRILHAILSHHGELEYGSPKRPKTIEALVLHFCDNLDAKITTFTYTLENNVSEVTGWTDYNKYFTRQLKK